MSNSSISAASAPSRGRLFKEEESAFRSPFQRDRDRIIHSTAFRRLEYKTQVFVNHEGDHYRTRLTHSIEVSQISRTLAGALGLDLHLAESIALAHDLGHTPFGHAGEDAMREVYPDFDHNAQTIKILTKLERRYADFDGLNLTWETLEGIAKHNGPNLHPPKALQEYNKLNNLELGTYPSLEAQMASLADDIAYVGHDIDDGLRAGLFKISDLLNVPLAGEVFGQVLKKYPDIELSRQMHEAHRRILSEMVEDLLKTTTANIAKTGVKTVADVRAAGQMIGAFSPEMEAKIKAVKAWLMQNMYRHKKVNVMTDKAKKTVIELFQYFVANPNKLPKEWLARAGKEGVDEVVADYIAGMTDRFATLEFQKISA